VPDHLLRIGGHPSSATRPFPVSRQSSYQGLPHGGPFLC
jgi:hypothetical protein